MMQIFRGSNFPIVSIKCAVFLVGDFFIFLLISISNQSKNITSSNSKPLKSNGHANEILKRNTIRNNTLPAQNAIKIDHYTMHVSGLGLEISGQKPQNRLPSFTVRCSKMLHR